MPIMEDLRIAKTKLSIENAMMELIEIKGFSNIKIVDIAKRAMVNRNTIYLHYSSKEEIVLSILNRTYGGDSFKDNFTSLFVSKVLKRDTNKLISKLVDAINSNIELYRIVLTDPNLNGYIQYRIEQFRKMVISILKNTKSNTLKLDYMMSGTFGVISRWVIYAGYSKEEIISELTNLVLNGIKSLEK